MHPDAHPYLSELRALSLLSDIAFESSAYEGALALTRPASLSTTTMPN